MATETKIPLWRTLAETDPEIAGAIRDELHRQNSGLELIASENFVSRAVMEAAGSVMTNKYAEGYPGKRYYGGCEFVDVAERAAIARATAPFGPDHANVQPHAGAPVFTDMAHIAGLVAAGVHPSPIAHSDFVTTTTHKTLRGPRGGLVLCREQYAKDLDRTVFPGVQGGPLMHIIAAKAVCLQEAAEPAFKVYQKQIVANAKRLANALTLAGLR